MAFHDVTGGGWRDLFEAARAAMDKAYAPYSNFHVGAAVRAPDGSVHAGCNVENAAYPQGWCAECSALANLVSSGARRAMEVAVVGARSDGAGGYLDDDGLCTPCGGCRQKIREFAAPETEIHICGPEGLRRTFTLADLLPESFGPENLEP